MWLFLAQNLKNLLPCLTSPPSICKNVVFLAKNNFFFKFRIKFPIWKFLGWNSKKLLYCDILHRHPQVFLNTKFHPKIKIFKFATKIGLIRYFSLEFHKTNVVFEISILEFVNMKRFFEKQRDFKLVSKIILFRYFWAAT